MFNDVLIDSLLRPFIHFVGKKTWKPPDVQQDYPPARASSRKAVCAFVRQQGKVRPPQGTTCKWASWWMAAWHVFLWWGRRAFSRGELGGPPPRCCLLWALRYLSSRKECPWTHSIWVQIPLESLMVSQENTFPGQILQHTQKRWVSLWVGGEHVESAMGRQTGGILLPGGDGKGPGPESWNKQRRGRQRRTVRLEDERSQTHRWSGRRCVLGGWAVRCVLRGLRGCVSTCMQMSAGGAADSWPQFWLPSSPVIDSFTTVSSRWSLHIYSSVNWQSLSLDGHHLVFYIWKRI